MKALLLAAGLGTRLRPLTLFRPKPLCLFYGQPILDLAYGQVLRGGVSSIAINVHYLADKIRDHVAVERSVYKEKPLISFEEEILGTGGCINPLRAWLARDPLLIFNADIIADLDVNALLSQHLASGADATMVLLPHLKEGTTPVSWDGERRIKGIGGNHSGRKATFAGIHIVGPKLVDAIPKQGFQHIIDSYQALLSAGGKVEAFLHEGFWADLGTPEDYFGAHEALLKSKNRKKIAERLSLSPGIRWLEKDNSAVLDQVYEGQLKDSFLFGPAQLESVQSIQQCIVYPSSQLDGKFEIKRMIISPETQLSF